MDPDTKKKLEPIKREHITDFLAFIDQDPYFMLKNYDENTHTSRFYIQGRALTPYEYKWFEFEMKLNENYPFTPPIVTCLTDTSHPLINLDRKPSSTFPSNVLLSILEVGENVSREINQQGWLPSKSLAMVAQALKDIIHLENSMFKDPQFSWYQNFEEIMKFYKEAYEMAKKSGQATEEIFPMKEKTKEYRFEMAELPQEIKVLNLSPLLRISEVRSQIQRHFKLSPILSHSIRLELRGRFMDDNHYLFQYKYSLSDETIKFHFFRS